jgi:hypothetical protein
MQFATLYTCAYCETKYALFRLYCQHCGCVLPDALTDQHEVTKLLVGNRAEPVDVMWGTTYFHRNARLFFRQEQTSEVIPVTLDHSPVLIGRRNTDFIPTVAFSQEDAEVMGISRRHARIERNDATLVITDLNSTNGTFLDGRPLIPQIPAPLHNRGVLQLGKLVLRIHFS